MNKRTKVVKNDFLPTDSDAVLRVFCARVVNANDDENVLELALDVRNEWSSSGFLKKSNVLSNAI
jgi:glyoxylate carboligase